MSTPPTSYFVPIVMERATGRPLGVPLISTPEGQVLIVFASMEGQLSQFLNRAEEGVGAAETVNALAVTASTLDEVADVVRGQQLLPPNVRLILEGTEAGDQALASL